MAAFSRQDTPILCSALLARMKPWPIDEMCVALLRDRFYQCSLCVETVFLYNAGTLVS